jgi:predicted CXXCH cytochrome family protein
MNKFILAKTVFFAFVLSIISLNCVFGQATTLTSANPAIAAAIICPGTLKVPIYAFTLTATGTVNFTALNFTTNAGYIAGDITRFQLWYASSNNFANANTQYGGDITTALGPGLHTFPNAFSRSINTTGRYFWITADITSGATANNIITVAALTTANITVSAGTKAGTAYIGGNQTISVPGSVTVSGGGTICGTSATLTATGGTGGTIYWQNTISNGTSTATPSNSQTVTSSGTYYFRARNSGGCWGPQGAVNVVVNGQPTITLGSNLVVCNGVVTANLTYTATTGTPNQYSIDYDVTANTQGFIDITNAALPSSPIIIVVPPGAATGTYNYTVTVRNGSTGCTSVSYAKTITINPILTTTGSITGPPNVGPLSSGLVYSVVSIQGASNYLWTVPTGWSIAGGIGSNSITVTSGAAGQNGNITVQASNSCGNASVSNLAVVVNIPHNNCSQCHLNHNSYGTALAIINGNANLCMSCHNPAGTASSKPFNNSMKSIPGVSGTSHSWDITAVNYKYGANMPTNSSMLSRMDNYIILCSTCHNQHSSAAPDYMRTSNAGDAMCKNCHTVRNVGRYADNTAVNIGSHPVGITYNSGDPRFVASPISPVELITSKVECSSCHKVHHSPNSNGYALRMEYSDALCIKCHVSMAPRRNLVHEGLSCISCHITHKAGLTNIMLIRDTINTPNSGAKPVIFIANNNASGFAGGSSPFKGVCEACHTQTDHYTNTSGGTTDARHVPATQSCVTCHPHEDAFYAQTNCLDCHKAITDKPGIGPAGGRRQIVDVNGNGTGLGGDFKRSSHHVSGTVPNTSDCILCHYMGDHQKGTVKLMDPDSGYLKIITYNPLIKASLESFCINCHDADGAGGDLTPFSDNIAVPFVDKSIWTSSSHKNKPLSCADCHDNGHGSNKRHILTPFNKVADANADPMDDEEDFCYKSCHTTGGIAATNTESEFAVTGHKHQVDEVTQFGTNSGLECISCHNPHQNTHTNLTSNPDNNKILWTQTTNSVRDFCVKCHDGTPPTGIAFSATYYGSGWNKSKYVNSRHDAVLNTGETNFSGTKGDCLVCHDKHATASADAATSKTGQYTMIKWRYDKSGNVASNALNSYAAADYNLCYRCHQTTLTTTNNAFEDLHSEHASSQQSPCIICHDVHSGYDASEGGLVNYSYANNASANLGGGDVGLGSYTLSSVYTQTATQGNCYMRCHATWGGNNRNHSDNYSRNGSLGYPWSYTWPF